MMTDIVADAKTYLGNKLFCLLNCTWDFLTDMDREELISATHI